MFEKLEVRGIDASGFWGVNSVNTIAYHKEPIRASNLIRGQLWRSMKEFNAEVLLVHARQASIGEPKINTNNHPFVNGDWTLGLVHNGRINEFDKLRQYYEVASNCDSEVLLRIIEATPEEADSFLGIDRNIAKRLSGIQSIFRQVRQGHMAVAVGEMLDEGHRELWLFRNEHRTLWTFDLRDSLGQIFFCSTPDIWQESLNECRVPSAVANRNKMINVPVDEVWHFHIDPNNPCPTGVQRYRISRTFDVNDQLSPQPWVPYLRGSPKGKCFTGLPKNESPPAPKPNQHLANCDELQNLLAEVRKSIESGVKDDEEVEYVLYQARSALQDCIKTVRTHCK